MDRIWRRALNRFADRLGYQRKSAITGYKITHHHPERWDTSMIRPIHVDLEYRGSHITGYVYPRLRGLVPVNSGRGGPFGYPDKFKPTGSSDA